PRRRARTVTELKILALRRGPSRRRATVVIYNLPGIVMFALSLAAAFGVGHLVGRSESGLLMVIAGPLAAGLDLGYRSMREKRDWYHPERGGSLFFLPVWLFGVVWTVLGAVYLLRGLD